MKSIIFKGGDYLLAIVGAAVSHDPDLEIGEILLQYGLER
jgi:hypothetical protein